VLVTSHHWTQYGTTSLKVSRGIHAIYLKSIFSQIRQPIPWSTRKSPIMTEYAVSRLPRECYTFRAAFRCIYSKKPYTKMPNFDTWTVDAVDNRLLMGCGISQNLFSRTEHHDQTVSTHHSSYPQKIHNDMEKTVTRCCHVTRRQRPICFSAGCKTLP
jgi:hypothetical protein